MTDQKFDFDNDTIRVFHDDRNYCTVIQWTRLAGTQKFGFQFFYADIEADKCHDLHCLLDSFWRCLEKGLARLANSNTPQ